MKVVSHVGYIKEVVDFPAGQKANPIVVFFACNLKLW